MCVSVHVCVSAHMLSGLYYESSYFYLSIDLFQQDEKLFLDQHVLTKLAVLINAVGNTLC